MKEINQRTDVGVRWTGKGYENLIKLFLIKKFQPTRLEFLNKKYILNLCITYKCQLFNLLLIKTLYLFFWHSHFKILMLL
jgi:hypothetical protein